jgi:glycerophosphoryl diester phosphodiesterase
MAASSAISWLYEKPIAHRGLHDQTLGVIENSISAAKAAIRKGYAIECDVQLTRDGEVVVFHDDTLERLTRGAGRVSDHDAAELTRMELCGTKDAISLLSDFLEALGDGAPLVIEIKSRFDGDLRLARRVAELVAGHDSPVVIESFDPDPIAFLRNHGSSLGVAHVPLGIVAQARYEIRDWPDLSQSQAADLTHFLHYPRTRPDFLSWNFDDLPNAIPFLCRCGLDIPVTAWTVQSRTQADIAAKWADQIVFEGFTPRRVST